LRSPRACGSIAAFGSGYRVMRMAGYKRKLRFLRGYRRRNAFPLAKNNLL
jgi:hypothetical protein